MPELRIENTDTPALPHDRGHEHVHEEIHPLKTGMKNTIMPDKAEELEFSYENES